MLLWNVRKQNKDTFNNKTYTCYIPKCLETYDDANYKPFCKNYLLTDWRALIKAKHNS